MLVIDPKPDVDLLHRVLAHIETNPETWRQDAYRTYESDDVDAPVTAYCFAGRTAVMTGAQVPVIRRGWYLAPDGTPSENSDCHVSTWAQEKLGLTWDESNKLFSWENTLKRLRTLVTEYVNRAHAIEMYEAVVLGEHEAIPMHGHGAAMSVEKGTSE